MCGICGLYGPEYSREDLDWRARRMVGTVTHRGPDAQGIFVGDGVALGHRRLSILDLSPATARKIGITRRIGVAEVKVAPIAVKLPDGTLKTGSGAPKEPICRVASS